MTINSENFPLEEAVFIKANEIKKNEKMLQIIYENDYQTDMNATFKKLRDMGISRVGIASSHDSIFQKFLSPRYDSRGLHTRMAPLLETVKAAKNYFEDVFVSLCVEELAPNGFDATEGIAVAKELVKCDVRDIIASSGTRDFFPLYERRRTQKKFEEDGEFFSNLPYLSSSLWLIQNIEARIWAIAYEDIYKCINIAKDIELYGLIKIVELGGIETNCSLEIEQSNIL